MSRTPPRSAEREGLDRETGVKPVRSVERAIGILFAVCRSAQPVGLSEISRATGVDKATALRLLGTLEGSGLVQRDETSRKYGPGSGVWKLTASWQGDLRLVAEPHLESLRRATEESVSLLTRRGFERVVVMALDAQHELRVVPTVNRVQPVYAGASGKVIMAHLPEDERERIVRETGLAPVNEGDAIDRDSFLEALERVRRDGYAYSVGDVTPGASAIAAPVFDRSGGVAAVVSLRGPDVRMPLRRIRQLAPLVVGAAEAISRDLAHEPSLGASA